jgi:hypothetical protein
MLGSAIALSLGGWAAIIMQNATHADIPDVVELPAEEPMAPVPQANRSANQNTAQSITQTTRQVRPMLRSRSSN